MSTAKQIKQKKRNPLPADVKKLFDTAKELKINLSEVARKLKRSRFHIYKVRDGEYNDPKVINLVIKMVEKEKLKLEKQQKKIKEVL